MAEEKVMMSLSLALDLQMFMIEKPQSGKDCGNLFLIVYFDSSFNSSTYSWACCAAILPSPVASS